MGLHVIESGDVAQAFQKYQQVRYLRTGRVQLTAMSDSTFAIRGIEASVTFLRDAQRKVVGLTLNQNGVQRARLADQCRGTAIVFQHDARVC